LLIVTVMDFSSYLLGTPSSVTRTFIAQTPIWLELGVQLKAPVLPLMVAPVGGVIRLKVSVLAGTSWSVAVAVKERTLPHGVDRVAGTESTGATFTSLTVIVISSSS